jgi:hypothetical protein
MSTPSPPIIIDSGATGHFFKVSSNLLGLKLATTSIAVSLPDGAHIRSTHTGTLPIPGLPLSAYQLVAPTVSRHCNRTHSYPSDNFAITAAKPSSPMTALPSLVTTSCYSPASDPLPPTDSGPSIPSGRPQPHPSRHPVPSPARSMPCFTPPWRTTPLSIELHFIMPSFFLRPYPHGVMLLMLDTSRHDLVSRPPLSASTLPNPHPYIKGIWIKYELTYGRLASPRPSCNNQPLMPISRTTWHHQQTTTPAQD